MKSFSLLVLFIVTMFLFSCKENSSSISKITNHTNVPVIVTVIVHKNRNDLSNAWKEHAKKYNIQDNKARLGFSWWTETDPTKCTIHVMDINSKNDSEMQTWGHELAHCIYGSYHKDGK